ncbi:hypothetical protein MRX96_007885 [Rhipicephalus microplus]
MPRSPGDDVSEPRDSVVATATDGATTSADMPDNDENGCAEEPASTEEDNLDLFQRKIKTEKGELGNLIFGSFRITRRGVVG